MWRAALLRVAAALGRGKGRPLAALVLIVALALQGGLGQRWLAGPRLTLFDLYQRLFPRERTSAPVVIVAVDEASLAAVGKWPWPRNKLADLVTRILDDHPAALGIDILMPEPDLLSPEEWAKLEGGLSPSLKDALASLPRNDALLAAAFRRGPVAIGVAGIEAGPPAQGRLTPVRIHGGSTADLQRMLPSYPAMLRSIPVIDAAAAGHGLVSTPDEGDRVVRRVAMVSDLGGTPVPSLVVEVLRLAADTPFLELYVDGGSVSGIGIGDLGLPTQADGSLWIDYSPHAEGRYISAAEVLAGRAPTGFFSDRLVLLGVTGLGLVDVPVTPVGAMPGVEVDAELLENVIDGRLARRPGWVPPAELGLTLLFGGLLIWAMPRLGFRMQGVLALATGGVLAGIGPTPWIIARLLVDVAPTALASAGLWAVLFTNSMVVAEAHRRELRRALDAERLAAAKLAGEIAAAARIQRSILPSPDALPPDPRFDLYARLVPAREVGGDLYDFAVIEGRRLFFTVGDVSGKGVPASLFMALGKALYKSTVLRQGGDIGEITTEANIEISRENSETLFITLFAGLLDLETGDLAFCNAGHDAPYLLRQGEPPARLETKRRAPALGIMEDFPYAADHARLTPGAALCLMTDGVPEAIDEGGELLGQERTTDIFAALGGETGPREIVEATFAGVARFVGAAEPADDITLLALRWNGVSAP